jgi:hypothetical protein
MRGVRRVWVLAGVVQTALALAGAWLWLGFDWEERAGFDLLRIAWFLGNAPGCLAALMTLLCGGLAVYSWIRVGREP